MASLICYNSCFVVLLVDLLCCSSDLALLCSGRELGDKEGNSSSESGVLCDFGS